MSEHRGDANPWMTPGEFGAFLAKDRNVWSELVSQTGALLD
jgi:hypothetical protein